MLSFLQLFKSIVTCNDFLRKKQMNTHERMCGAVYCLQNVSQSTSSKKQAHFWILPMMISKPLIAETFAMFDSQQIVLILPVEEIQYNDLLFLNRV